MALMIALVGEQPLPNFLLARHEHPDALLLIYTIPKTEPVYRNLEAALKSETPIYALPTDPYNVLVIIKDLKNKLAEKELASHQSLVFNLTGGTKAMSLAAYQVAQQLSTTIVYMESEGKNNQLFRYEFKQGQLLLQKIDALTECVQLKDFFNLHLSRKWGKKELDDQLGSIFQKVVADALQAHGYEVMLGVQAMQGQVDIDVAVRFKNQFGIIETKCGKKGRELEGIQQLSTAKRHLGTFTQQFYVITVPRTPVHKEIVEAANIKVISLLEYKCGETSLSSSDTKALIEQVDESFKD